MSKHILNYYFLYPAHTPRFFLKNMKWSLQLGCKKFKSQNKFKSLYTSLFVIAGNVSHLKVCHLRRFCPFKNDFLCFQFFSKGIQWVLGVKSNQKHIYKMYVRPKLHFAYLKIMMLPKTPPFPSCELTFVFSKHRMLLIQQDSSGICESE